MVGFVVFDIPVWKKIKPSGLPILLVRFFFYGVSKCSFTLFSVKRPCPSMLETEQRATCVVHWVRPSVSRFSMWSFTSHRAPVSRPFKISPLSSLIWITAFAPSSVFYLIRRSSSILTGLKILLRTQCSKTFMLYSSAWFIINASLPHISLTISISLRISIAHTEILSYLGGSRAFFGLSLKILCNMYTAMISLHNSCSIFLVIGQMPLLR